MMYLVEFFCFFLVFSMIGVACNPSVYFGAGSLVIGAGVGCGILVMMGCSFISVLLFLIYLGGMLVVFAYSVALACDMYPEWWGDRFVGVYFGGYILLVVVLGILFGEWQLIGLGVFWADSLGLSMVRVDLSGVSLLYNWGVGGLLICGWALLLTLFVVLELTRGLVRGSLREI